MTATLDAPAAAAIPAGTPRVIGIDPSLTCTGIVSSLGWVETIGRKDITKLPLHDRIAAVDALVAEILSCVSGADLVVIESPAFTRSGGGSVERHALWWAIARGLIRREVPIAEVTATCRARYATGKGNARKAVVVDAVARRWPQYETGGNDNVADAVALCAMGLDRLGHPLTPMPQTHRAALTAVTWPEEVGR